MCRRHAPPHFGYVTTADSIALKPRSLGAELALALFYRGAELALVAYHDAVMLAASRLL